MEIDVRHISKEDAKAIVFPNHYSGTWNSTFGLVNLGVFKGEELLGAAVFGHLMNPASAASIADLPPASIIELNRLWVDDRLGANTESAMLSRCFRWLKANTRVQLVQSFADGRLGCGTIYKAANFGYYGKDRTRFYRKRDTGETFHAALTNDGRSLATMIRHNELWVDGDLDTFEVYTYRYLYPLTKYARRKVLLKPKPYPPYNRGVIENPYTYPLALLARCYVICEAKGDPRARKFIDYLTAHAAPEVVDRLITEADENEWVAAVVAEAEAQPALFVA